MQNYKKNFVTRTLAWVLAAVMVIAMVPVGVFAETYKEVEEGGSVVEKTTDWSENARKKEESDTDSWPLSLTNRFVRVSPSDPLKTPDINYVGTYTNTDGREVIRLVFNAQVASANQWDKLLIRFPKDLAEKVDVKNPFTGIYKGKNNYGSHDAIDIQFIDSQMSEIKANLEEVAWNLAGGQNVYSVDLAKNGSVVPGSRYLPIDLVLKQGETIKNAKRDLLIQARLVDKNYERVYLRAGERTNDYMQYTFTTTIPQKNNYKVYMNDDLSLVNPERANSTYNKFHSTVSSVKFNIQKGYLEVYHRQSKYDTTTFAAPYAIRQAVDSDFYRLLDVRNGKVGEVYLLGADANVYPGYGDRKDYEPNNQSKIPFGKGDIYQPEGSDIGFIQVAGKDWDTTQEYEDGIKTLKSNSVSTSDAIVGTAASTANGGIYTVVRYFIKPNELRKLIKDNGLKSYTFRTSILRANTTKYTGQKSDGVSVYKFINNKERNLKRRDKVKLQFKAAQYNKKGGPYLHAPQIIIGDEFYNIDFLHTVAFDATGLEATWTVPFDIKLKKGEQITVKSIDWDEKNRSNVLTLNFGNSDTLLSNSHKVDYAPFEMTRSASLTGGAIVSTIGKPNVDEIFTDSKNITGHSFYEGAEINIKYFDDTDNKAVRQTISAIGPDKKDDNYDYSKILTKAKYVNGEEYDAFGFDTLKPNQGGIVQGDKKFADFKMPTLVRDMPIKVSNLDTLSSFIESNDVIEQVQTRFRFDLNGQMSKDNKSVIDKIAPLSKEYTNITEDKMSADGETVETPAGAHNDSYRPSGFQGENVKYADDTNNTIELTEKIDGKNVKRTYQNIANHDGLKYDLKKNDQKEAFLARQMPDSYDINLPKGKKVIGWTTVKLKDTADKTAEEQFYDLKNSDKVVKAVEDWNDAENNAYIFDKESPIDKERTVYAVYGGLSIVLHSGIKGADGKYIIKRVPITQSDIDNNFDNLDGLTSASINKYRQNNNIFVKTGMPEAPYTYREKDVEAADPLLKEFIKPNSSFVGWWAPNSDDIESVKNSQNSDKEALMFARQNNKFNAGEPIDYNERIAGLISGKLKIGNTVKNTVKSAEDLTHMMKNNSFAVLPNGFKFVFTPNDFKVDGKFLQTNDEVFDKINEIHLYAVYREFFDVTVHPRYSKIDRTSAKSEDQIDKNNIKYGDYGKYEGEVEADKQKDLKISLLTRTAVTGYGEPTAAANANYEPITDLVPQELAGNIDNEIFKTWNHTTNEALKWTLPGFDKLGRRKSYVAVVVQDGKENAYKQFGIPEFNDRTWGTLGIQVYLKAGGVSLDENAPKNLHKNETNRDAYGYALAKTQTVTFKKQKPQEGVDAFTMATSRQSIVKTGKNEVSGYDIIMTNSPVEIPVPKFAEPIRTTDQVVALEWPSDNYTEKDFEDIAKVKIKLALKKEENQPQQYKEFELTIDPTTKQITTKESGITAEIKTGKVHDNETDRKLLFITGLDLTGTGGNTINAWYSKKQGEDYSIGEPGYAVIIGIRTSEKVSEMKQTAKVNPEDKPKIEFVIPEKTLDKVSVGTKYIAEKWVPDANDPTQGQWVKVGEKELTNADKTGTNFDNVKTTIELDENPAPGSGIKPVKDGDIVRIVSYEKNHDAIYTEEEKANGAIDGYALPNYSTRKEIQDPKHKNKTIDVPAITEAPSKATQNHRPENIEYVKLDLKAPEVTKAVAKEDDPFRRFIDITAQLDEVPDGQEVTIEFGDVQGKKENFKKTFPNKTTAIEYLNQIPRREDMPKMWIIAKDRFGNQKPVEATYNKTYQMYVAIIQPHAGDDFIEALVDRAGAEIVIDVLDSNGNKVAQAKGTAQAAQTYEILDIYKLNGTQTTTDLYELKATDVLVISASKTEGRKEYTTNPLSLEVLN